MLNATLMMKCTINTWLESVDDKIAEAAQALQLAQEEKELDFNGIAESEALHETEEQWHWKIALVATLSLRCCPAHPTSSSQMCNEGFVFCAYKKRT